MKLSLRKPLACALVALSFALLPAAACDVDAPALGGLAGSGAVDGSPRNPDPRPYAGSGGAGGEGGAPAFEPATTYQGMVYDAETDLWCVPTGGCIEGPGPGGPAPAPGPSLPDCPPPPTPCR